MRLGQSSRVGLRVRADSFVSGTVSFLARHPAGSVFLAAAAVRLLPLLLFPDAIEPGTDFRNRYEPIALALLHGDGFSLGGTPTAVAGPVYPALLAGVYGLFGVGADTAVRAVLALLDAAQCALLFLIARRHFGAATAWWAGLGMALCPYFIVSIYRMGSETSFLFLHAAFLILLGGAASLRPAARSLGAGVCLGLAALCRAVVLLLPIALALLLPLRRRPAFGARQYVLLVLGFALSVGPWIARHRVTYDRFIPVQTLGGFHAYAGAGGGEYASNAWAPEADAAYYRKAGEAIAANPPRFLRRSAIRLAKMWYSTDSGRHEVLLALANIPLLLLAGIGVWLSRARWRELSYLYVVFLYYVAVHASMAVVFRYMLPVVPILILFAAVTAHAGVTAGIGALRSRPAAAEVAGDA